MTLVPISCSSSAVVSASCGGDLGGLTSLLLSVTLSGASAPRPGMWVQGEVSGFTFKVYECSRAGLTLPSFKLNWKPTQSKTCLRSSFNFSS